MQYLSVLVQLSEGSQGLVQVRGLKVVFKCGVSRPQGLSALSLAQGLVTSAVLTSDAI